MARLPAVLLGAGFGLGLTVLAVGLRRRPRPDTAGGGRLARLARGRGPLQIAAGLVAAAVVVAATGWLVGGVLAALAAWTPTSMPGRPGCAGWKASPPGPNRSWPRSAAQRVWSRPSS